MQIAEERQVYVKLLERSIDDLKCIVCALENKVSQQCFCYFYKVEIIEEGKRHRMQQEELDMELQKVRPQMIAVSPSGREWSSVEDGVVDLTGSSRLACL